MIVHEAGHFAGIPDGGPSTSIMNAILEEGSPNYGSVPGCVNHEPNRRVSKRRSPILNGPRRVAKG